jgi:hypothetical protein
VTTDVDWAMMKRLKPTGSAMTDTMSSRLPTHPDGLTSAWLSAILDAPVASVQILHHAFSTNQRARIGLTYEEGGDGPDSLFVKLAPLDEGHRAMIGAIGMGERESRFFSDVSEGIDLRVPRCHFAGADGNDFVLLLEDLTKSDCRFSQGEWGVT